MLTFYKSLMFQKLLILITVFSSWYFYSQLTPLGLRPKDIEILDNGTIGLVSALFVVVPGSWVGKGEGVWMVSSEGTIFGRIIKWDPFLGGSHKQQMYGNFEGFPWL